MLLERDVQAERWIGDWWLVIGEALAKPLASSWHGHPARVPSMGGTPMPRAHLPYTLLASTWHGHPARVPPMGGTPMPRAHLPVTLLASTWHGHPARVPSMGGTPMPRWFCKSLWWLVVVVAPTMSRAVSVTGSPDTEVRCHENGRAEPGGERGGALYFSSSSSPAPGTAGTAVPAGTAGGWRPIPTAMPHYSPGIPAWRPYSLRPLGTHGMPCVY
jgi:hypothetical protein